MEKELKNFRIIYEESYHIDIQAKDEEDARDIFMSGECDAKPKFRELESVEVYTN